MDTRQHIIDVTIELLEQLPAERVSTRDICRAAGITQPTLYHHFGDKEGLLHSVAMYGFQAYFAGRQSFAQSSDPVEVLYYAWNAHVEFGVAHPSLYALMFGSGRSDSESPAAVESRALITRALEQTARAGRLHTEIGQATLIVEAGMVGTTLQAIRSGHDDAVSDHLRDAVLGSVIAGVPRITPETSLTSVAGQLAVGLDDFASELGSLKPVEIALLKEWLRMLIVGTRDLEATAKR